MTQKDSRIWESKNQSKRLVLGQGVMRSESSSKGDESMLSRKVTEVSIYYPYYKPTQVDEERI